MFAMLSGASFANSLNKIIYNMMGNYIHTFIYEI